MAGEWIEVSFPAVVDFQEGPGILAKDFREAGVPLVRLAGLERGASVLAGCNYLDPDTVGKRWSHFALAKGDVLLSTSASLGRIAVVSDDGVGAIPYTGIIRMRPRDQRLVASFIRYLLEGPDFQRQAEMVGAGSVIRHFGPMHLRQMFVKLPPPAEQRAIAHILGTLDRKIELNRGMSETLEVMARALFKSWFVDFDPVRAKAERRDPGLPQRLADLFPGRLVDSELGEIPEGWEIGPLESALVLQRGFDLPAGKRTPGSYPILAASGPNGTHNEFMVRGPGVTTGRSGVLGKVFYVLEDFWPLNTSLWVREFRRASPAYAFHLLSRLDFAQFNAGSAVPTLNRNHVHSLPTLLPPAALVAAFEQFTAACLQRQFALAREAGTLAALRDALLPKLVSGDLRVPPKRAQALSEDLQAAIRLD